MASSVDLNPARAVQQPIAVHTPSALSVVAQVALKCLLTMTIICPLAMGIYETLRHKEVKNLFAVDKRVLPIELFVKGLHEIWGQHRTSHLETMTADPEAVKKLRTDQMSDYQLSVVANRKDLVQHMEYCQVHTLLSRLNQDGVAAQLSEDQVRGCYVESVISSDSSVYKQNLAQLLTNYLTPAMASTLDIKQFSKKNSLLLNLLLDKNELVQALTGDQLVDLHIHQCRSLDSFSNKLTSSQRVAFVNKAIERKAFINFLHEGPSTLKLYYSDCATVEEKNRLVVLWDSDSVVRFLNLTNCHYSIKDLNPNNLLRAFRVAGTTLRVTILACGTSETFHAIVEQYSKTATDRTILKESLSYVPNHCQKETFHLLIPIIQEMDRNEKGNILLRLSVEQRQWYSDFNAQGHSLVFD